MLGVLDQGVDGRTFQAKMERRVALLLGEVLRAARRTKRATSVANHSVQVTKSETLYYTENHLRILMLCLTIALKYSKYNSHPVVITPRQGCRSHCVSKESKPESSPEKQPEFPQPDTKPHPVSRFIRVE